jgi:hypothetical protein
MAYIRQERPTVGQGELKGERRIRSEFVRIELEMESGTEQRSDD